MCLHRWPSTLSRLPATTSPNREAGDQRGRLVGFGDLLDSFAAKGDNVLAVKISYWIPVK